MSTPDQYLTSLDFFKQRNRTAGTVILAILIIVVVILIIYLAIYFMSKIPKKCSDSPSGPTNVQAAYINDGTFQVRWDPVPDVDKYTVYIGQTFDFTRVQSISVTTSTRARADIKGLELARTYYILVSASNNCGESVNSERITFIFVPA